MGSPTASERKRLVTESLPFVRAVAAKVKEQMPREIEFDELVAYGTQGLLEAAERFDGNHGAAFTTYAYYRIRGAIFDGLRRMGWVPRGDYARMRVEERAAAFLENLADREAGAAVFGGGERSLEEEVHDLAAALGGVAAIFVTSLGEHDEETPDLDHQPHERMERRELARTVREVVALLPEKERRLIELYYFEEKTLAEAGAELGLSKSWTSRLHARAVEQVHQALAAREPPSAPAPAAPRKRRRANSRK